MARKLTFLHEERSFECAVTKVDRHKLYGRKEIVATNPKGTPLQKGYLDEWGSVVIASTAMGYLDETRRWHAKNELIAVDGSGKPLTMLPSSFDRPIELKDTVDLFTFMEHEAAMVYVLKGYGVDEWVSELTLKDRFYTFPFCYRSAYDARPAFLNPVGDELFMIVGNPVELAYLSKPQRTEIEDDEDFDDDLDFSMM